MWVEDHYSIHITLRPILHALLFYQLNVIFFTRNCSTIWVNGVFLNIICIINARSLNTTF